jgi:PAS domain S-box-containing protein
MRMAWIVGLQRWVSVATAVSLLVTAAALVFALTAAARAHADSQVLSRRLVPAAAASGVLLGQYADQQTSLRNYVTSGRATGLAAFRQAAGPVPAEQARVAGLVRGYPVMPAELAAAETAQQAWLAQVAAPQLAAVARGDLARARALQADSVVVRPFVLAVRTGMATLQAQITSVQGQVIAQVVAAQRRLLAALLAVCAVVAVSNGGAVIVVRRWLIRPFSVLRRAAESVAAGDYGTRVPEVGPAELAELGRTTELMRTRLVAALAKAELAEERFRGLFDSSPVATLTVAADGSIIMVNALAELMFGYGAGELTGQPAEMLVPVGLPSGSTCDRAGALAAPQSRPTGSGMMLSAVRKDGRQFPVEISLSSLPTEHGTVVSAAIVDITDRLAAQAERDRLQAEAERERYERRLQQSQRLESLGQLVGGVAHDFNNMMNVIGGYADFIAEEVTGLAGHDSRLDAVLADVEQVRDAARRAAQLTRQLLIFARRDVVHLDVLNVNQVIGGVEELLHRTLGEHVGLTVTPAAGLWHVKADAGQLEQVLVNLAVNARDAMPGGGSLTVDTGNVEVDEEYATSWPGLTPGRYVRLRVSDTGTGMEREVLARVFEPFYSTKPKGAGTGLGLATVYGIVTRAGGYAQIYSEPGLGTTVTALLPAVQDAAVAAAPVAAAPVSGGGETILLVEDEESLREMACRILTRGGYQVCSAITPAEAVRHAGDPEQHIDLLLTDVIMPEMLGNEVAALVRAARPSLPVLFMSGYTQQVLDTQGALDPDVDLLEKPFSAAILLNRVRQAIMTGGAPGLEVAAVANSAADG